MQRAGAVLVAPFTPQQWPVYRDLRLASLQDAAHAFGATHAEQRDWPDVLWQMRLQAGVATQDACPLLATCAGAPAGLAWGRIEAGVVVEPALDPAAAAVAATPFDAAGHAARSKPAQPHAAPVVHLYQVWVAPAWRGRGVAQALLDAVIAWARTRQASAVHLGVAEGASAALRLYLRAGFVQHGAPTLLRPGASLLSQPMRLLLHPAAAAPAAQAIEPPSSRSSQSSPSSQESPSSQASHPSPSPRNP